MTALGKDIERLRKLEPTVVIAREATAQERQRVEAPNLGEGGETSVFRREGDYWTVVYEGTLVRLRDSKGLRLLARLFAQPGREPTYRAGSGAEPRHRRRARPLAPLLS
jgi:hypothetical protein